MEGAIELIGGEVGIRVIGGIIFFIFFIAILAWSQRSMRKMGQNWQEVAELNGLAYSTSPLSVDYGGLIGSRTFEYPGMAGNYRGRAVQVHSQAGMQQSDAGKWLLEASVMLNNPKPFSALAHKRGFENLAKERIKKDSKTGVKAIDKDFKVRSEDPAFVTQVFENLTVVEALKQHKFKNGHFMFDGNRLHFVGAVNGRQTSPEQAIALLNLLSDVADAAR